MKNVLAKMVVTYKDWAEKLPFALWGYGTSIRTSTRATPYSLVYGSEAVLPIEAVLPVGGNQGPRRGLAKVRYEQLDLIDKKRARAQYHA